jgi:hypothetical protein
MIYLFTRFLIAGQSICFAMVGFLFVYQSVSLEQGLLAHQASISTR